MQIAMKSVAIDICTVDENWWKQGRCSRALVVVGADVGLLVVGCSVMPGSSHLIQHQDQPQHEKKDGCCSSG